MIVAATICDLIGYKPIALIFALLSHFFLDAMPHYGFGLTGNIILFIPTCFFLIYISWRKCNYYVLLSAFIGILPDVNRFLGLSKTLNKIHMLYHFRSHNMPIELFIIELIFTLSLVGLLLYEEELLPD